MIQVNGNEYDEETFEQALDALSANSHSSEPKIRPRSDFVDHLGQQYGGDRDIYEVLGYSEEITASQYRAKYRRQDIAKRIVELPAQDTWRVDPDLEDDVDTEQETQFEQDIETLQNQHRFYHYCSRADVSAGIGEYGLLFLGFTDGQALNQPVNDEVLEGTEDLAFMTPFAQDHVHDWTLGREEGLDATHPRYNKPVLYEIDFTDLDADDDDDDNVEEVHYTRLVHIAEGLVESDLKGTPRLRPVYNRLEDLEKVTGASAEMFWTGADRKFHFDIDTEDTQRIDPGALDNLDEEVKKLVHDMEQYVKTFNTDLEVIGGEDPDPSGIIDELLKFISGATGIPKRILTGSERGELASSQDRANWYGNIETRQNSFAEPVILRPIIDKFIEYGIISAPEGGNYVVEWPNLFELTEVEEAEAMNTRAQALDRAAPGGNTDLLGTPEEIMDFVVEGEKPEFEDEGDIELPSEERELPGEREEATEDEEEAVEEAEQQFESQFGE